jgi:hypothetical protein
LFEPLHRRHEIIALTSSVESNLGILWDMYYETFPSPPWATIFYGSRDQRPPGSLLPKRKVPGYEVEVV